MQSNLPEIERSKLFLSDIIFSMEKIIKYTQGISFDEFVKNEILVDATIRNIEIIGEAARAVAKEIKEKNNDIPWQQMTGLRNILIHEYFGIDLEIIWVIIQKNIPETLPQIRHLLNT